MNRFGLVLAGLMLIAAGNPQSETEHVVDDGETLGGIANRAGVPLPVIAAANGLVEPYDVRVGQTLIIPRQRTHTVKNGDTGSVIAERYGIPFDLIAVANGLKPPYTVRTGQKLIIPAAGAVEPPQVQRRQRPYFRAPHDGQILRGYGRRADGGGHEGLDYEAAVGDMVRASATGMVVAVSTDDKRFGRMVVLEHGNGWRTRYGHLARMTVSEGELVRAGERIGIAGDSGEAERPELHFEILKDGSPVDPVSLLAEDGA